MNMDPQKWLQENKTLRMDANSSLFPEDRRKLHLARYEFAVAYVGGLRVLDAACGTGYGTAVLGQAAASAVGIDMEAAAVEYAAQTYGQLHVQFQKSFVEGTPFPQAEFDVVVSFETVEHTLCPASHMREVVRLLKPGTGIAVMSVPNAWGYTDHHFFDFDRQSFAELLAPHFGRVEWFYQNPPSDPVQPGIGPIVTGQERAHCLVAVCTSPVKAGPSALPTRAEDIMAEIYGHVFTRHRDYLALREAYRTDVWARIGRKLRKTFG